MDGWNDGWIFMFVLRGRGVTWAYGTAAGDEGGVTVARACVPRQGHRVLRRRRWHLVNEEEYEGQWSKGRRNGVGIAYFPDGNPHFKCQRKDDEIGEREEVIEHSHNGNVKYKRGFLDGLRHGHGTEYDDYYGPRPELGGRGFAHHKAYEGHGPRARKRARAQCSTRTDARSHHPAAANTHESISLFCARKCQGEWANGLPWLRHRVRPRDGRQKIRGRVVL
ncbi:unnamed protein product [Vitrella brassicaformis CCMP3155]|uniref:Uncharacterized protein n=1 Tax=Vitrella brassicaformis (strain CCMP3155) TaxID=1169540 RepID=A0A0G4GFH5_VITBC|nr:unnamed protein product [Vitrella brassicaformis CCMP3155]|eukprot:CEM28274.1 unnamed protein product [Vitrella brassicaformis CCMP3155]